MSTAPAAAPRESTAADRAAVIFLPYLAALVIPVGLMAANVQLLSSLDVIGFAIGLAVVVALCADGLARLLVRRPENRALVAALLVACFFAYDHAHRLIGHASQLPWQAQLAAWCGACLGLGFAVRNWPEARARLACRAAALLCAVVIGMQFSGLAAGLFRGTPARQTAAKVAPAAIRPAAELPDVYYIILDAYARQDVLQSLYEFDNSPFTDALRQRGFHVASASRANYPHTRLSLASSLNLDYVDRLMRIDPTSRATRPLADLIRASRVDDYLRQAGYRTVSFASGYSYTERRDSDRYIRFSALDRLSEPHLALLKATLAWPLLQQHTQALHEDRVLGTFRGLPALAAERDGPRFIFAHVVCPHAPFVFNAEGKAVWHTRDTTDADALIGPGPEQISLETYRDLYRQQVQFVNGQMLAAIDGILKSSAKPPLIIIQSDHGPASELRLNSAEHTNAWERLSNFHAAYVPPGCDIRFPDDHSVVNTFRLVLNGLCGAEFELLPTRCYFAYWSRPLELVEITARTLPPHRSLGIESVAEAAPPPLEPSAGELNSRRQPD